MPRHLWFSRHPRILLKWWRWGLLREGGSDSKQKILSKRYLHSIREVYPQDWDRILAERARVDSDDCQTLSWEPGAPKWFDANSCLWWRPLLQEEGALYEWIVLVIDCRQETDLEIPIRKLEQVFGETSWLLGLPLTAPIRPVQWIFAAKLEYSK